MYTLVPKWFDKCSQCCQRKECVERSERLFFDSILECSEKRRCIILFEELNLIIMPSPISCQWVENTASGHAAYQKESEVILSES